MWYRHSIRAGECSKMVKLLKIKSNKCYECNEGGKGY